MYPVHRQPKTCNRQQGADHRILLTPMLFSLFALVQVPQANLGQTNLGPVPFVGKWVKLVEVGIFLLKWVKVGWRRWKWVEVSWSGLKLVFFVEVRDVGWRELKWAEVGKLGFTNRENKALIGYSRLKHTFSEIAQSDASCVCILNFRKEKFKKHCVTPWWAHTIWWLIIYRTRYECKEI